MAGLDTLILNKIVPLVLEKQLVFKPFPKNTSLLEQWDIWLDKLAMLFLVNLPDNLGYQYWITTELFRMGNQKNIISDLSEKKQNNIGSVNINEKNTRKY